MKKLITRTALTAAAFAIALAFALMVALGGPQSATAQSAMPTATPTPTPSPTPVPRGTDADGDGLIEITTAAQLDVMRYDLDGNGVVDLDAQGTVDPNHPIKVIKYRNHFNTSNIGCAPDAGASPNAGAAATLKTPQCEGYELAADIDLSGIDYSNWFPIDGWQTEFNGNGYAISNMTTTGAGLFASISASGTVRNVGLRNATAARGAADGNAGALAGLNYGMIETSYATGAVSYANAAAQAVPSGVRHIVRAHIGGFVGVNRGTIIASWADVDVSIRGSGARAGGFAGTNKGRIVASYSHGDVAVADITPTTDGRNGFSRVGGFVAVNNGAGKIIISYSTGSVTAPGTNQFGSFVHVYQRGLGDADIADSYWDTDKSGLTFDNNGGLCSFPNGKTTARLREIKQTGVDRDCPGYENHHRPAPTMTPTPTPTR